MHQNMGQRSKMGGRWRGVYISTTLTQTVVLKCRPSPGAKSQPTKLKFATQRLEEGNPRCLRVPQPLETLIPTDLSSL